MVHNCEANLAASSLLGPAHGRDLRPCQSADPRGSRRVTGGGLLSLLAIGCPVCNKLVVLALEVSGALRVFAPIQPLLGLASLALVTSALWVRLGTATACPVPAARQRPAS